MEVKLAIPIILLAALTGIALSMGAASKIDGDWLQADNHNHGSNSEIKETHEHALFYVVVNDTELSFLERKYQLASRAVHLENNRSHIVHKHLEGVTWREFLTTINAGLERRNGTYCGKFKNYSYCGEATVRLNGENVTDLDKEIQQDDKLVIVLQPDYEEWVEKYESKELPPAYRPQKIRGRSL